MQRNPIQRFEELLEQFEDDFSHVRRNSGEIGTPAADLVEKDGEFVVTFDLPGFDSEDIDLRITDHTLHLHAEHGSTAAFEEEDFVHRERTRTDVSRTVSLPEDVDEDAVAASYEDGVLTVTLPKEHDEDEDDDRRISIA